MSENKKKSLDPGAKKNLIFVGVVAAVAIGFVVFAGFIGGGEKPGEQSNLGSLGGRVDSQGGQLIGENQKYTEALKNANLEGADRATDSGKSFFPDQPNELGDGAKKKDTSAVLEERRPVAETAAAQPNEYQRVGYERQQAQAEVQRGPMVDGPDSAWNLVSRKLVWLRDKAEESSIEESSIKDGLAQAATAATGTATAQQNPVEASPALPVTFLEPYGAVLLSPIDTDKPGLVRGRVTTGPAKGLVMAGQATRKGDYVNVTFTGGVLNGVSYSFTAYAMDTQTADSYLEGKVDRKYFARYGLPIILAAVNAAGQVATNTGATTVVGASSTTVSAPQPETKQIAAAAVGAAAGTVSENLKSERNELAPRVQIPNGQGIAVVFTSQGRGESK